MLYSISENQTERDHQTSIIRPISSNALSKILEFWQFRQVGVNGVLYTNICAFSEFLIKNAENLNAQTLKVHNSTAPCDIGKCYMEDEYCFFTNHVILENIITSGNIFQCHMVDEITTDATFNITFNGKISINILFGPSDWSSAEASLTSIYE